MKGAAWSRLAKPITGIVFAVAAGTWTVGQLREQEVARRDQQALARMTQKMKTICVGRFLVDMPEEARLELTRPRIHGFDISSLEFTMDTGKSAKGPVPSSLSQEAVLSLWDKISSSIRYHHAPSAPGTRRQAPARSAT